MVTQDSKGVFNRRFVSHTVLGLKMAVNLKLRLALLPALLFVAAALAREDDFSIVERYPEREEVNKFKIFYSLTKYGN